MKIKAKPNKKKVVFIIRANTFSRYLKLNMIIIKGSLLSSSLEPK